MISGCRVTISKVKQNNLNNIKLLTFKSKNYASYKASISEYNANVDYFLQLCFFKKTLDKKNINQVIDITN